MERRSVARLVLLHDDNRRLATAAGQSRLGTRLPTSWHRTEERTNIPGSQEILITTKRSRK
jgi:hypothetical protein